MKLAAASDVLGHVDSSNFVGGNVDPIAGIGKVLGSAVNLFIVVAGLVLLIFMLWGAFDWIVSGGEKERVAKAQSKITNALIGMFLVFAVLTIWGLVTGHILNIIEIGPSGGWNLHIPTLNP